MFASKPFKCSWIPALLMVFALTPTANAAPMPSRDTGVGLLIAQQGNQALLAIRADLKRSVHSWRPTLPPQVLTASLPPAGGSGSMAPGQRCAK